MLIHASVMSESPRSGLTESEGLARRGGTSWERKDPLQDVWHRAVPVDALGVCGHAGGHTEVYAAAAGPAHHGRFPDSAGRRESGQTLTIFQSAGSCAWAEAVSAGAIILRKFSFVTLEVCSTATTLHPALCMQTLAPSTTQ